MFVLVSARAPFLVARVPWSVVPLSRASTASKIATTPTTALTNHGRTHRGAATVPLILPTHVVQSCWWRCCDFTGERCFFDRRRGCSFGSRGSRALLQQYQFWMQATGNGVKKKAPSHSPLKAATKSHPEPHTTQKPPRATSRKQSEPLSTFRHWTGP